MIDTRHHTVDAHVGVGQEHRVVERVESRCGEERVDEPGPHDAVVDRRVVAGEPPGGDGRRLR